MLLIELLKGTPWKTGNGLLVEFTVSGENDGIIEARNSLTARGETRPGSLAWLHRHIAANTVASTTFLRPSISGSSTPAPIMKSKLFCFANVIWRISGI